MKFGVREICDVVFKAKQKTKIGNREFVTGEPVLYLDTAKTSTLEGAATTVYAQGGKGNSRLIAWEGEKTLTFTVEDALLSPIGFSVLSGAGLIDVESEKDLIHVHMTSDVLVEERDGKLVGVLTSENFDDAVVNVCGPTTTVRIFGTVLDGSGAGIRSLGACTIDEDASKKADTLCCAYEVSDENEVVIVLGENAPVAAYETVRLDYYVLKTSGAQVIDITADSFAGSYYVEASTLFRRQDTGSDMPAELIIPNVKIQSNFSFAMASSGDPSTFTFTMDAFPGYTTFDKTKQILCAIQIIGTDASGSGDEDTDGVNGQCCHVSGTDSESETEGE